jgi:hypothetical protein
LGVILSDDGKSGVRRLNFTGMFPYDGIAPYRSWRKAVSSVDRHAVDPQVKARFALDRSTKIASAGSCFASRIAEHVQNYGFTYQLVEPGPPWLDAAERKVHGYGEYSARYGNIYSALQLLQIAQRALGLFDPLERAWAAKDGFVDPFRPSIQPDGFLSERELENDRRQHLAAVERLLTETDVLIFTLGLTEIWYDARDGAVFPSAPRRGQGTFDPKRHLYRNLSVAENVDALEQFLELLRSINPGAKVILTVSPVPLAATMEDHHVLVSSTYSKAVLRVAADEIVRRHRHVDYFSSYEIVMATGHTETYFADDRRHVTDAAVDHVMTSFYRNYCGEDLAAMAPVARNEAAMTYASKPCDEELLLDYLAADTSLETQ